jgi:hypothetical protein
MNSLKAPTSNGEILDKISILLIKKLHSDNEYIQKELEQLIILSDKNGILSKKYLEELFYINSNLWIIEDRLRILEKENKFDLEFITLARLVYKFNDIRAQIKGKINKETNSELMEIKIYD